MLLALFLANQIQRVMKKAIYIAAIFVLASAADAAAQHVSFVASFGAPRAWDVPVAVAEVVYHDYYQYDWVHATRYTRHGRWNYRVLLQRGNSFLELDVNRFGRVRRVRTRNHYPLGGHVCGSHCGFHSNFYNSFHVTCTSPFHHGHNHVAFRPRPVNYVWGHYYNYPAYNKVVYHTTVVNNQPVYHQPRKKRTYRHEVRREDNRYVRRQRYPARRQGSHYESRDNKYQREDRKSEDGKRNSRGRRGRR